MATVADVLKRIERLKKDLEYVRSFQEKWRDQRERFPEIYEGILKQERAFLKKIDDLKSLRVDALEALGAEADTAPSSAAIVSGDGVGGASAPIIPASPAHESNDEKRAAAIDGIGEKLRKRPKIDTAPSVPAVVSESMGTDAALK
jgi:hypothetical protein